MKNKVLVLTCITFFTVLFLGFTISTNADENFNDKTINIMQNKGVAKDSILTKYEYKKNFTLSVDKKKVFTLCNASGNIEIVKHDGNNIEIEAKIKIYNVDKDYADDIADSIIKVIESNLEVKSDNFMKFYKGKKNISINVDYSIKIPNGISINIDNSYGDIDIRDLYGDVDIKNYSGNTELENINGALKFDSEYGNVYMKNIYGNVEVGNYSGDLDIENIDGLLKLDSQYGDASIKNVTDDVEITNYTGDIIFSKVGGNVLIKKSSYGDVQASYINGDCSINSYTGDIELENIDGSAKIDSEYGNIDLNEIKKGVYIEGYTGRIELKNSNIIEHDVDIKNEYGDINLIIPEEQEGYFKIDTEYGEIKSDFDFNVHKDDWDESDQYVHQRIGQDDINFKINNYNGEVNIKANKDKNSSKPLVQVEDKKNNNQSNDKKEEKSFEVIKHVDINGIRNIDVDSSKINVEYAVGKKEYMILKFYGKIEKDCDKPDILIYKDNEKMHIEFKYIQQDDQNINDNQHYEDVNLKIYVPEAWLLKA